MAKKKIENADEVAKVEDMAVGKAADLPDEDVLIEKPKEGLAAELGEVKELEEEIVEEVKKKSAFEKEGWKPKTSLGIKVKNGEVNSIDYALDKRIKVLEPEIVDALLPNLSTDLLMVGQSKGKFGGGQKRIFKQTQKKTQEGNKPKFATFAVVGYEDGYVGVGYGKSKETVPAREKAIRQAKLNVIKIRRGCGNWRCGHGTVFTEHHQRTSHCRWIVFNRSCLSGSDRVPSARTLRVHRCGSHPCRGFDCRHLTGAPCVSLRRSAGCVSNRPCSLQNAQ